MKILLLSDSHGNDPNMRRAVEIAKPDLLFFLGDGWRDLDALRERFPLLPCEQVAGNCDLGCSLEREKLVRLLGHTMLLCHGHTLGVKRGLLAATLTARERGAEVLLFGHTHAPFIDYHDGVWLVNPGSIGDPYHPSYGVLTLESDKIDPALYRL